MTLFFTLGHLAHAQQALCEDIAPGTSHIDVVTYNAWGLPTPVARDRRGRLPKIGTWIQDSGVDLAGLQEVWRGASSLLSSTLLSMPFLQPTGQGDSGLGLVTPHDVQNSHLQHFQAESGIDRLKAKGILWADLVLPDGSALRVGVTHLQSGGGARPAAVRAKQVEELLAGLAHDDPRAPVVLMGDFNFYDGLDEPALRQLASEGFVDAADVAGATEGTYPGLSHRFDRIYVRHGADQCLSPVSADVLPQKLSVGRALSDHRAVRAQVTLSSMQGQDVAE